MKEHAEARKAQFRECIKKMEENIDPNTLVIFGGDLNIRDAEVYCHLNWLATFYF